MADVFHYGLPDATAICGVLPGTDARRTSIRLINCEWCLNRLDRFIHEGYPLPPKPPASPSQQSTPEGGSRG